MTTAAEPAPYRPYEHTISLGSQEYLQVKDRVTWFRSEHPDAYIRTELVRYEHELGLALFRAQAGYFLLVGERTIEEELPDGGGRRITTEPIYREVYATGYGTELRSSFEDHLEKSETRAVGRALCQLGYGTAQALERELSEGSHVVDSPVARHTHPSAARLSRAQGEESASPPPAPSPPASPPTPAPAPAQDDQRAVLERLLESDPDAAGKLPKAPGEMTPSELTKTIAWLEKRARTLSATGSMLAAQSIVQPAAGVGAGAQSPPAPAPTLQVVPPQAAPQSAASPASTPVEPSPEESLAPPEGLAGWLARAEKVHVWLERYKAKHPGSLPSTFTPETLVNLREVYGVGYTYLHDAGLDAEPVEGLEPVALAPAIVDAAYMLCDHYQRHYPEQLAQRASA